MSNEHLPERAPIKKTLAGNFEIQHPHFKDYLYQERWLAASHWEKFRRGENPISRTRGAP